MLAKKNVILQDKIIILVGVDMYAIRNMLYSLITELSCCNSMSSCNQHGC